MKKLIIAIGIALSAYSSMHANAESESKVDLPMDVIVHKGESGADSIATVDLFAAIPYQMLRFSEKGNFYESIINVYIEIRHSNGESHTEFISLDTVNAKSYYAAQGGEGDFYPIVKRFSVNPADYSVHLILQGGNGLFISQNQKLVSVPDFDTYSVSLSGIMIVSQIQEVNGRLKITPHLSDNIYQLESGISLFYQIYSDTVKKAYTEWKIETESGEVVLTGSDGIIDIPEGKSQKRIYISDLDTLPIDKLIVKVVLRETGTGGDILALSDRTLVNIPADGYSIVKDIEGAIEKLLLVASADVLDSLENLETDVQKRKAFFEFWDKLDPSPNTRKNEAFEEYYARINYAEENFRTYAQGWLTDMGRVYVVMGQPNDINSNTSMNAQIAQQVWVYNNVGTFVFQDSSGFGDYRLVRPIGFRKKYRYGDSDGY